MAPIKRVKEEMEAREKFPEKYPDSALPSDIKLELYDQDDPLIIEATFPGPPNSLFERELVMTFSFPTNYPFKPYEVMLSFTLPHHRISTPYNYTIPPAAWRPNTFFWDAIIDLYKAMGDLHLDTLSSFLADNTPSTDGEHDQEKQHVVDIEGVEKSALFVVVPTSGTLGMSLYPCLDRQGEKREFVVKVTPGSPAEKAGVVPGWLLRRYCVQLRRDESKTWYCLPPKTTEWPSLASRAVLFEEPPPMVVPTVTKTPPNEGETRAESGSNDGAEDAKDSIRRKEKEARLVQEAIEQMFARGLLMERPLKDTRPNFSRAVSCAWAAGVTAIFMSKNMRDFNTRSFVNDVVKPVTLARGGCRLIDLVPLKHRAFAPLYFVSHAWDTPLSRTWGGFATAMLHNDRVSADGEGKTVLLSKALEAMKKHGWSLPEGLEWRVHEPQERRLHSAAFWYKDLECGHFAGIWTDAVMNCQHPGQDQADDFAAAFNLSGTGSRVLDAIRYTVMCPVALPSSPAPPMLARSWCCYEIALSYEHNLETFSTLSHGLVSVTDVSALYGHNVRLEEACAWAASDRDKINELLLEKFGSYEDANRVISKALIEGLAKRSNRAYTLDMNRLLENALLFIAHFARYLDLVRLHIDQDNTEAESHPGRPAEPDAGEGSASPPAGSAPSDQATEPSSEESSGPFQDVDAIPKETTGNDVQQGSAIQHQPGASPPSGAGQTVAGTPLPSQGAPPTKHGAGGARVADASCTCTIL